MQTHKFIPYIFLALSLATATAEDALLALVALQQKTLAEKGITTFYETARSQLWSPPKIRSKWAIGQVGDKDEKARLEAQFELGQDLLRALPNLVSVNDAKTELDSMQQLMDFADWVASKRCYGNALIARRAFDLALPFAGQLAVKEGTTDETLAALQTSLNPSWTSTAFVSAVLDDEAGTDIFAVAKTADDLRLIWTDGVRKAMDSNDPAWAKSLPAGLIPAPKLSPAKIAAEVLPFFIDDQMPPKPTAEALLLGKHHEIVVTAIEPANALRLRNLLAFRISVKVFPNEALKSDFYPGLKGAFDEAWRRHYKDKNLEGLSMKLGLAAWATYDAINRKQFMPDDEALATMP